MYDNICVSVYVIYLSIYIYVLYLYILIQSSMYVKKAAFCSIFNKSRCRLDKGTDSPQGSPVGLSSSWWSSWSSLRRHFHAPDFAQAGKCDFACVWNQKQLPILSYCHKYIYILYNIIYMYVSILYMMNERKWWINPIGVHCSNNDMTLYSYCPNSNIDVPSQFLSSAWASVIHWEKYSLTWQNDNGETTVGWSNSWMKNRMSKLKTKK